MPWIRISRVRLDLDKVILMIDSEASEGDRSITVTMLSGTSVDLVGVDATYFAAAFDEHFATRNITPPGKPPPLILGADLILPESELGAPGRVKG